jgi:type I restriction enzyme, S subunit
MWAITAILDHEASETAGAGGTFQVVSLIDDDGNDLTDLIDEGTYFDSMDQLRQAILKEISKRLTVDE